MRRTIRCLSPALMAVAILLVGTGIALAGVHTTGFDMEKTCPTVVASGESFNCSVTIANNDPQHGVVNLAVTNEVPFPGGTVTPLTCLQPFDPAECAGTPSGSPVNSLGPAGSPTASCGACIPETAPFNCESSNTFLVDEVRASGNDADALPPPNGFGGLPVSTATTNATPVAPHVCDDNDACTTDVCDPADPDGCVSTPITCDDNDACTTDTCDPAVGCVFTAITCDDNDACTTDTCDPVLGCVNTPISCDDNDACTTDSCDPVLGCVNETITCDDNDVCTDDTCDPATGCVFTPDPTNDPSCVPGEEICRTPGFFGTHACGLTGDCEKEGSQDITGALIEAFNTANPGDPLTICGTDITNADVGNVNSALEAICVSPKGDSVLQLARQLMAAALNCILTTGGTGEACVSLEGAVCEGVSIEDVFNACNAACEAGAVTATVDSTEINCIEVIDCFNNGGAEFDPILGCTGDSGCHDAELDNGCVDFSPPGPAGSPKACNTARKNDVEITD